MRNTYSTGPRGAKGVSLAECGIPALRSFQTTGGLACPVRNAGFPPCGASRRQGDWPACPSRNAGFPPCGASRRQGDWRVPRRMRDPPVTELPTKAATGVSRAEYGIPECVSLSHSDSHYQKYILFPLHLQELYFSGRSPNSFSSGSFITFKDSIDIPAATLYSKGIPVPLSANDFLSFVRHNLLDTSDCCEVLECSRQNISYLVRHDMLHPLKEEVRGNLYMKGDVIRNSW